MPGPDDIPEKGNPEVFGQILFAKDKVEYHGQPLGLIVAESQVCLGVCAVCIVVSCSSFLDVGITSRPILVSLTPITPVSPLHKQTRLLISPQLPCCLHTNNT